jgi:hypothetical protein
MGEIVGNGAMRSESAIEVHVRASLRNCWHTRGIDTSEGMDYLHSLGFWNPRDPKNKTTAALSWNLRIRFFEMVQGPLSGAGDVCHLRLAQPELASQ